MFFEVEVVGIGSWFVFGVCDVVELKDVYEVIGFFEW